MLTRRTFLGSAAALAACDRSPLEVDDMALQKTVIPIKFTGLDTSKDPKTGATGRVQLLENAWASRDTDGGIELRKWPGTAAFSRSIDGGGSLSAGARVHAFGSELIVTDGGYLYSWSTFVGKWLKRGRAENISAELTQVSGNLNTGSFSSDIAYANGLAVHVVTNGGGAFTYIVEDVATNEVLLQANVTASGSRHPHVVAVGSDFFIFYQHTTNDLLCIKIAGATPTTASAPATVATDMDATFRFSDVIVDTGNSRMVLAYRNTTPGLTLAIWNTNMTAGTSVAYATRDPNKCLGFLDWDFSDGNGYLSICASASGQRLLVFGRSSMTVTSDTLMDAATTTARNVTGYYASGAANVFYEVPAASTMNTFINGWTAGSGAFVAARSVGLASKAFKVSGRYYFLAAYSSSVQGNLYLMGQDIGYAGTAGGMSVSGYLLAGNCGGLTFIDSNLGNCAPMSSTSVLLTYQSTGVLWQSLTRFTLTWGGSLLGDPVDFNGSLALPGAAPRIYDGMDVVEYGFGQVPEAPTLAQSAGGSLTTPASYQYVIVFSWTDKSGRLWRSAPSAPVTIALTGGNQTVTLTVPTLRVTEKCTTFNTSQVISSVQIEVYRTIGTAGTVFFRVTNALNTVTADSVTITDVSSDATVGMGEGLYTGTGAVENAAPAAVVAYAAHRDRLFAISADGAVYFTKDVTGGDAAHFSDADGFFLDFDSAEGALVAIVSDGTTLFVSKRSRIYLVSGDGPSLDGNNSYGFPQPLPSEVGFVSPRGFVGTPDGIIFKSAKGFHLLDRGGGIQIVPAPDAYDSLTVNGGVVLDDRTLAYFVTAEGRTLAWDWVLKQWYTTSSVRQPAVACARWQNQFVYLKSDGTVVKEVTASFADDGVGYTMKVTGAWVDLVNAFVQEIRIRGEAMATCTVSITTAQDFDETQATAKTIALTTASAKVWVEEPNEGYMEAIEVTISETSTTEGVRLSMLELEVGVLPGAKKVTSAQYFG